MAKEDPPPPENEMSVKEEKSTRSQIGLLITVVVGGLLIVGYRYKDQLAGDPSPPPVRADGSQWFEGGTLQDASVLEWQQASEENKLATCADIIVAQLQSGGLVPDIAARAQNSDSLYPLAKELMECLDSGLEPLPDPNENRAKYQDEQLLLNATMAIGLKLEWTQAPPLLSL